MPGSSSGSELQNSALPGLQSSGLGPSVTETGDTEDGTSRIHTSCPGIPQAGPIKDAYFPKDTSSLMPNLIFQII